MNRPSRLLKSNSAEAILATALCIIAAATCALAWPMVGHADDGAPNPFLMPGETDPGWPFVRGPNFDGRSAEINLAEEWPADGPPVLWTRDLGQGYSGLVAWQDRVATQCQTLAGQYVVCLRADTGESIWEYRYDWPYEAAGVYPGPRATPTYFEGRLYFAAPSGLVGCLDAADGRLLWSVNVKEAHQGKGTDFGYSCSPVVADGKVLLPVGGRGSGGAGASMVALSPVDGSLVWKAGDDAASYSPAYPISFRGRRLVLGYLQNALVCHDLQTGERLWRRELSAGYDEHSAWPIYREPHLWLSGPFRAGCELLKFSDDFHEAPSLVWHSDIMSNDIASSVLVDDAIYGFDLRDAQAKTHRPSRGQFRSIEFLSGKGLWAIGDLNVRHLPEDKPAEWGAHVGHASLIAADGKLLLLNDTGELILARASPAQYEELGRVTILGGEIGWTVPSLCRGRLFARNQSRAVCVYVGRSELLAPESRAASVSARQIPNSKFVDWSAVILGIEPEYAFDLPSSRWLLEWGLASVALLVVSALAAWAVRACGGSRVGPAGGRWIFWTLAFVLGALGTTALSRWRGDFVFTWPVQLFVMFQATIYELRSRRGPSASHGVRWRSRLVVLLFLATCCGYFLICRRLSLVFEWVFLCGFAAALPFLLVGAFTYRERRWCAAWECLWTLLGFSAFYGSSVLVLLLRA